MTTTMVPAPHAVLTQAEARDRASRVTNVSYDLEIELQRGASTYRGSARIGFDAVPAEAPIFLEYRGRAIERAELNGEPVDVAWDGTRIHLAADALAARNELLVVYENPYDKTGDGFHHYVDPEDGEEYLYSNFEPYDANRLFPCFDQPDIKATYRLTVTAPDDWTIISNGPETSVEAAGDGRTSHSFEEPARYSTYLFALVAGPYRSAYRDHNGLRLGLHCRGSLERHLDPDELFEVTAQGMDFYADLFGRPYPFTKYDQIFCPEFNIGAMENIGAVTFTEKYVFRDPPTETQRIDRAEVVLHELAHMWFGNLVTMRWWNDLWLNESFASYISLLAIDEATRFEGAWQAFNFYMKRWAYRQDQLVTTHPVAGEAADTDAAFLNFDGITYGKGASVLKQLVATIGPEAFRDGMRIYFDRYSFGNATLSEFIGALEEGSGRELQDWSRIWLETPSVNTIAAHWEADGQLERLRLEQTAFPEYPTLRPHRLEVGLATEGAEGVAIEGIAVTLEEADVEVEAARGRPTPVFVFPNHNDHAYARVLLDDRSLAFVRDGLSRVTDPLQRQLLWLSLWEMVRDQRVRSTEFLELAARHLPSETDGLILESSIAGAVTSVASFVPEPMRVAEARAFFQASLGALRGASADDVRTIWARTLIAAAATREDVGTLTRIADDVEPIAGLTVDQEMRWNIAVKAVAYGLDGATERLAEERRRDPSDRADRMESRAVAARPDISGKEEVWARILADEYPSLQLALDAMQGFNWTHQREIIEPYGERFFQVVRDVFGRTDQRYGMGFVRHLFPAYRAERVDLERSEQLLAEIGGETPMLTRLLREANDELARAIACREFAARPG